MAGVTGFEATGELSSAYAKGGSLLAIVNLKWIQENLESMLGYSK